MDTYWRFFYKMKNLLADRLHQFLLKAYVNQNWDLTLEQCELLLFSTTLLTSDGDKYSLITKRGIWHLFIHSWPFSKASNITVPLKHGNIKTMYLVLKFHRKVQHFGLRILEKSTISQF